jgi:tetratricopeptide (TPR) repeat protein
MRKPSKNEELKADLATLKLEVDALQISTMTHRTPWYKNASTLIALAAISISTASTGYSILNQRAKDWNSERVELLKFLVEMADLNQKDYVLKNGDETVEDEGKKATNINQISGFHNQKNALLLRAAADFINGNPGISFSSGEYYTVGAGLFAAAEVQQALEMFEKCVNVSRDFYGQIGCQRSKANTLFQLNRVEEGREAYLVALEIFARPEFGKSDQFLQHTTNAITYQNWAYSEANKGNLKEAAKQITMASAIVDKLLPSPMKSDLQKSIASARATFNASTANLQ